MMGRRQTPVPAGPLHDFAQGLRALRDRAGAPPYRQLAHGAGFSHSVLSDAAAGRRLPTLQATLAFVRACGGDAQEVQAWRERWTRLHHTLRATHPALLPAPQQRPAPEPTPGPASAPGRKSPAVSAAPAAEVLYSSPGAPVAGRDGGMPQQPGSVAPLEQGDPPRVGPFRLLGRLGSGAMGRVYLAVSRAGWPVAVKVVRSDLADDVYFRGRFAAEVTAARRVQGLYTPAVVDADPQASPPWMATAYIPGPSLEEVVNADGPLPAQVVRSLAAGLAEALQAIHAAGIVHRDLKPGNVLLDADGPKVIDFGVAAAADASRLTRTGAWVGTAGFLAPEQIDGGPVTPAADVFSLGSLLAYAATGVTPFGDDPTGEVLHRITHADPDLAALTSEDNNLQELISACLRKDATRRPTPRQIIDAAADTRVGGAWLPTAISSQIARRSAELTDVLARAARQRTLYRIKLSALPMLLALAITMFIALGNSGRSSATPTLTAPPDPTATATASSARADTPPTTALSHTPTSTHSSIRTTEPLTPTGPAIAAPATASADTNTAGAGTGGTPASSRNGSAQGQAGTSACLTSPSRSSCDGQDAATEGCTADAVTVPHGVLQTTLADGVSFLVELEWSSRCGTNWTRARPTGGRSDYFNDWISPQRSVISGMASGWYTQSGWLVSPMAYADAAATPAGACVMISGTAQPYWACTPRLYPNGSG